MSDISARTTKVAAFAVADLLHRYEVIGKPVPTAVVTALDELRSAHRRTAPDVQPVAVQPFEHIDVPTASQRLGISIRAVQKRCAAGTLSAQRVGRRSWLIRWEQGWQGSSSTTPGTPGPTSPTASTTG